MKRGQVIVCDKKVLVRRLPDLAHKIGFKVKERGLALVKPNICGLYHPSLEVLSSVIEYLEPHVSEIVVGETHSMMHSPEEQFRRLGVNTLLEQFGGQVKALDLSRDQTVKVSVPRPHALKELEIPETVLKADILVNVPKVGSHSTTRITSALKNLFGLLPQKRKYSIYHPLGMDKVIADIAQVVKTNLNVVDAGQRAILGLDPLSVDIVACRLINLDPLKVEHLSLVSGDQKEKLEHIIRKLQVNEL